MNLYEAVRMQRIRAAVRAVRTGGACSSVWRCARYSVRTVMRVAVCGSALGSVWQCARQCAAVQRCARYSVRTVMHVAVCGSALGSVWQCARQCAAVRSTYYYAHSRSQYIYWYVLIEAVGVSPILLTYWYELTDQYELLIRIKVI